MTRRTVAAVALGALAVAGCSGQASHSPSSTSPTSSTRSTPPPIGPVPHPPPNARPGLGSLVIISHAPGSTVKSHILAWYSRVKLQVNALRREVGAMHTDGSIGYAGGLENACARLGATTDVLLAPHNRPPKRPFQFFSGWELAMKSYQTSAQACLLHQYSTSAAALNTGTKALAMATAAIPSH